MKNLYKKILFAFFFSLQVSFLNAQWVTIPDNNFVNWLYSHGFADCMNGNLMDTTCSPVTDTTVLYCTSSNIQDLDGIQHFDSLQILRCTNNNLTGLPQLPGSLKELYCYNNLLTSLPSLPASLQVLSCNDNQLTVLPALPGSIQSLFCYGNFITSLPSLPNSLIDVGCSYNQLTFLPVLPSNLNTLGCDYNQISILPALPLSLTLLECTHNQISVLPSLPSTLIQFGCSYNQISVIPSLPSTLTQFACSNNQISVLPILPSGLQQLNCDHNQIQALPALPPALIYLYCYNNLLSSLPSLPADLFNLSCTHNLLTTLPSLPNTLHHLICDSNQLVSLPVFSDSLRWLTCMYNQLTSIPEFPDSLFYCGISYNPDLTCLPKLKRIVIFNFDSTGIECLPNYGTVTSGYPSISSVPLCDVFNANGCTAYWNISGKVYLDSDNNCISDANELRQSNMKLLLDSGGTLIQQTYTGGEGLYSFDTDTGIYTYTIDTTDLPVMVTCPALGFQTSALTAVDSMDYDMDFGMQCKPGFDVGATSVVRDSGIFRPAHFARVRIAAGDISNLYGLHCVSGINGTVQVIISGAVSYIGATTGALTPAVSGDTLLYSIADFGTVNFNSDFSFLVETDTTAVNGNQICFDVNVLPLAGDINPSNNSLQHCFTVVNSVDPNIKEVFPEGNIDTSQHWLTYTVNFQNTGSAPAEHICILDTLDNDLDESSFTLLSYSHQPLTQVVGKVIRFNFPNINLPDSTSDEAHSHGYVQFKVKLKTGLTNGTLIHNTAHIVFDFNAPVTTNTTENVIQTTTNLTPNPSPNERGVQVVPNPAHDEVNIVFSSKNKFTIEIVNAPGEILVKKENQKRIDVSGLAKGIYFVKVFYGNNLVTEKFVKE